MSDDTSKTTEKADKAENDWKLEQRLRNEALAWDAERKKLAAKVDDESWPMALENQRRSLERGKLEDARSAEIHPLKIQEITSAHLAHIAHAAMANTVPGFHEDLLKHCRRLEVTCERQATAWESIAKSLAVLAAK